MSNQRRGQKHSHTFKQRTLGQETRPMFWPTCMLCGHVLSQLPVVMYGFVRDSLLAVGSPIHICLLGSSPEAQEFHQGLVVF
jgi:hypothetical protein